MSSGLRRMRWRSSRSPRMLTARSTVTPQGRWLTLPLSQTRTRFMATCGEYFRNNVLDAPDFDALSVPRYNQNQFGATLGVPIIRNKLFFFGDGEAKPHCLWRNLHGDSADRRYEARKFF
jgi:hypothetical protein